MGHAGYGPLDSDDAMAVIEAWEDLLQKKGMSPARATRALLDEWGDVASSGREAEVMALTAICLRKKIPIGKRLREAAVTAINNELAADALEGWMSPTKRKNALLRLLLLFYLPLGFAASLRRTSRRISDQSSLVSGVDGSSSRSRSRRSRSGFSCAT